MPFPEIASEVFLARNTIKSQANSICRTLGAGSRGQGGSPGSAGWACWTADERSFHAICMMEPAPAPGAMVLNGEEDRGIQARR